MNRPAIVWHLRQRMAAEGIFKTTELVPLLAERGVALSREQVYRLVTATPQRLNIEVLAALCDILGCTPNDLIEVRAATAAERVEVNGTTTDAQLPASIGSLRPVPAKISRPIGQ